MAAPGPIVTVPLFPKLTRELHGLLASLKEPEWKSRPSPSEWTVHDLAAHLLDTTLRRLSAQRDDFTADDAPTEFRSYDDLLEFLNALNRDWVVAMRRLSPRTLVELLEFADAKLCAFFAAQDPDGPARFPVAWAGESASKNWFDIAREYTEKWHHTQQIFEATQRSSTIMTREFMLPMLDTFFRALPHALREQPAATGECVRVEVHGRFDAAWTAQRGADSWSLDNDPACEPAATVRCTPRTAWKICTARNASSKFLAAYPDIELSGDPGLANAVLGIVAVMI